MQVFILFIVRPFLSIKQRRDFVRECLKLMKEICIHTQLLKKKNLNVWSNKKSKILFRGLRTLRTHWEYFIINIDMQIQRSNSKESDITFINIKDVAQNSHDGNAQGFWKTQGVCIRISDTSLHPLRDDIYIPDIGIIIPLTMHNLVRSKSRTHQVTRFPNSIPSALSHVSPEPPVKTKTRSCENPACE